MSTSENISKCWEALRWPTPELLNGLKAGSYHSARLSGVWSYEDLITGFRREKVDKPTLFIGAGTCGLGAGAGKTIEAVRVFLKTNGIAADLIRVGRIGLCSEEPILDIQLPGRTRVSFRSVSFDKVDGLLKAVFASVIPENMVLGQYRPANTEHKSWENH